MKRLSFFITSLILFPLLTFAAPANGTGLQNFFKNLLAFINDKLIPFMIGIAFLFFVINAIRFFVFQGAEEEGRENAKSLAQYGVLAFVFLILFWGTINLLSSSIGLQGKSAPIPDYMELNKSKTSSGGSSSGGSTSGGSSSGGSATNNSTCTATQQQFDNTFGGPCATNNQ